MNINFKIKGLEMNIQNEGIIVIESMEIGVEDIKLSEIPAIIRETQSMMDAHHRYTSAVEPSKGTFFKSMARSRDDDAAEYSSIDDDERREFVMSNDVDDENGATNRRHSKGITADALPSED